MVRWLIVLKAARRELASTAHPNVVRPIRLGGTVVDEDVIRGVLAFSLLYLAAFGVATVLLAVDASRVGSELTPLEAISASLATIGNIGPGFGAISPFGSYLEFPPTSKLLMIVLMWMGHLEILPVLAVLTSVFWRE